VSESQPSFSPPRVLPPHYFLLSLVLIVVIGWRLGGGLIGSPLVYVGALPMLAGLLLAWQGARQFAKADTNIIPLSKSTTLVTSGVFAYSRNPMYLGMLLFLGGLALVMDNGWGWLVVLGFFLIIRLAFIRREEILMLETFGAAYANYKARVRRWL